MFGFAPDVGDMLDRPIPATATSKMSPNLESGMGLHGDGSTVPPAKKDAAAVRFGNVPNGTGGAALDTSSAVGAYLCVIADAAKGLAGGSSLA